MDEKSMMRILTEAYATGTRDLAAREVTYIYYRDGHPIFVKETPPVAVEEHS